MSNLPDPGPLVLKAEQQLQQGAWQAAAACAQQAWDALPAPALPTTSAGTNAGLAHGGFAVSAPQADPHAPWRRRAGLALYQARYRTGALAAAVELGQALMPLIDEPPLPLAERVEFLRTLALCAVELLRFDLALEYAQQAHQAARSDGEGHPGQLSLATNTLGCVYERMGDPWQGERLLGEALALAREDGADEHTRFVALNNLCGVLIGKHYLLRDLGPDADALAPLRQAVPHAREATVLADRRGVPFFRVFAWGNLGEVLTHLGHLDDAEPALQRALALAREHGFDAQRRRIEYSHCELALARGQALQALEGLQAVLREIGAADHPTTLLRVHHGLWRAAGQLGRAEQALHHLQVYLQQERQRSVRQLRAQSEQFVTRVEAEQARLQARHHRQRISELEADVLLDPLTGLNNRRAFDHQWPELLERSRLQPQQPLTVAMLDLDFFKLVNDRHGHAVGDRVLVELGGLLRAHTRQADLLVRLGGEEFLLAMPGTDSASALEVCERLREKVAQFPWGTLSDGLQITLSLGLASSPPWPHKLLLAEADAALYRAKSAGRNQLVVARPPAG